MAQCPLDLRQKRILREQDDLLNLDQRIEETRRARDAALHAFEQARTVMEDVNQELAELCARRDVACHELNELRLSYRRDYMANLPMDVLAYIFDDVATLPLALVDCFQCVDYYQRDYAFAPFSLAAVCHRWRTQALRQPSLWTYISAPCCMDKNGVGIHARRIDCLLERSQSCPLDILFRWHECGHHHHWVGSPSLETILQATLSCAHRWRVFELTLPDGVGKEKYTYALNGPLPLLESFRITSIEEGREAAPDLCFPFAPKLRELTVYGPNAVHPGPQGFSSLRSLRLWFQFSLRGMLPLLLGVADTLESLAIGISRDEIMHITTPHPTVLPRLKTLALDIDEDLCYAYRQFVTLRMPALEHLLLPAHTICEELTNFLEHVAETTHTLTLGGEIKTDHLDVLDRLTSLRTLVFDDFTARGEPQYPYHVSDDFFDTMALHENSDLWTSLQRVDLRLTGSISLRSGAGVLSFIRARTRRGEAGAAIHTRPCNIQAFEVPDKVPAWLTAEIARLLQE